MIIIICGVSGTGKSTIGALLAKSLDLNFYDGDDFHPRVNVDKMKSGFPLNDDDRGPWLERLAGVISKCADESGAVIACSALKENYRKILTSKWSGEPIWVFLTGTKELLNERLAARKGHFFAGTLLDSQLSTLALPSYGFKIDITPAPNEIVDDILFRLSAVSDGCGILMKEK